ncbi:Rossmann-fold NAD(P)-binding domain-containing protein [Agromyces kandeliae]|uniref:Uncharacterized protein n=1 Tax=Agromyces kandeliae TaxID=2666141 RepID=A0A6L5R621_9MICO|nr:hypothetical protein [Agromyces kandeliae]MRX44768.1 hypothetical protein [Agromyces kandeliae]
MGDDVLIVGASGILAPAAAELAARGHRVTGIAMRRDVPASVAALRVDVRDAHALGVALGSRRWGSAIVYEPATTSESRVLLEAAVDGNLVLVRTSAAADPANGEFRPPKGTLQLGWIAGPPPRWHDAEEVSSAALEVLADGRSRVLGVIRPWEERP